MACLKNIFLLVAVLIALVAASPIPEPGWGSKHVHYKIHVPYEVHHVHHHHVKKVHVPVVHEHLVVKEVHHDPLPVIHEPIHYDVPDFHGWW